MKRKLRINGHSHLLPYPEQIPSFMKEKEIFWVDDERKHMLQKGWKRPVTDSSFFLDEKLVWMERNRLDHAVVLNLSQLYGNGLRLEEMKKAALELIAATQKNFYKDKNIPTGFW